MALIPNLSAGMPVAASWGNSMRDRTIQRFETTAALLAWNPNGDGAMAWDDSTDRMYVRYAGVWELLTMVVGGSLSGTTTSAGYLTVSHGLPKAPRWVQIQPANANSTFYQTRVTSIAATSFTIHCRNYVGASIAKKAVSAYWSAGF